MNKLVIPDYIKLYLQKNISEREKRIQAERDRDIKHIDKQYIHKLNNKLTILIKKHWNNENPMLKNKELKISADEIISKWNYKLSEDFINLITNSDAFPRLKLKNKNYVIQKVVDESEPTIMFFDDGMFVISHIFESNYPEYKGKLINNNPLSTK
jgi:hypothetical protein